MFTLEQYLHIYSKTTTDCYVNYMQGARALKRFMHPVIFPAIPKNYIAPSILISYEVQELAKLLSKDQYNLSEVRARENTIVYTLVQQSLQNLEQIQ